MRQPILALDDHLINQMAAGEVIEHPASVVKELVENSLDAGATEIIVELLSGGRTFIKISDNGSGIPKEEIPLAFQRHATSKLRSIEDLHLLGTLGFRGEALASIASIAKVTMLTSCDDTYAHLYRVEGGHAVENKTSHRDKGTSIEVEDLFFNVPVRKKFLPIPDRLTHEVIKAVKGLALGHPEIAFTLVSDQKQIFKANITREAPFVDRMKERLLQVAPEQSREDWIPINIHDQDYRLSGWLLGPAHHRNNRSDETLLVNRRMVDPYLISLAVREGYGPSLPDKRHPVFLLHLTLPKGVVDINVHPQKKEIRLREKGHLHNFIAKGIERALFPLEKEVISALPPVNYKWESRSFLPQETKSFIEERQEEIPSLFSEEIPPLRPKILHCIKGAVIFDPLSFPPLLKEVEEGIAVLSLQRGYQKLLKAKVPTELPKQGLLIPKVLSLSSEEIKNFEVLGPSIETLGFELEYFGASGYLLRSIPAGHEEQAAIELLRAVLTGDKTPFKAPVYNRLLKVEEAEVLLQALAKLPSPAVGQDSAPLVKLLTINELLEIL